MTGRTVKEWVGASPDTNPPATVLLRIFRRYDGVCHISGRKIGPKDEWHAEHIKPLSMGGENRESNLAPALIEPHKEKSAEEAAERAKADAIAKRHIGIRTRPVVKLRGPKFAKSERTAAREPKAALPFKPLYRDMP